MFNLNTTNIRQSYHQYFKQMENLQQLTDKELMELQYSLNFDLNQVNDELMRRKRESKKREEKSIKDFLNKPEIRVKSTYPTEEFYDTLNMCLGY